MNVRAHTRDGGETRVQAYTRAVPGAGEAGRSKPGEHPQFAWTGFWPGQGGSLHHDRNQYQSCPPTTPGSNDPNWNSYGPSSSHCGYTDNRGRTGGPTSGYQCVYDDEGKLVTAPECQGTYDYSPPYGADNDLSGDRLWRHFVDDVLPWLKYGN